MKTKDMADLFNNTPNDRIAQAENYLLSHLAWSIIPVEQRRLLLLAEKLELKPQEARALIDNLVKTGQAKMTTQFGFLKTYQLADELCAQKMWELPKLPITTRKLYESIASYSYRNAIYTEWRKALFGYITKGKIIKLESSIDTDEHLFHLWKTLIQDPRWENFCLDISESLLFSFHSLIEEDWNTSLQPNMELAEKLFLKNSYLSDDERTLYQAYFAQYKYVLPGKIKDIPDNITLHCVPGICANAIYRQYQGLNSEALLLYRTMQKDNAIHFTNYPLYDMYYVLALMKDSEASSQKKLISLAKKKELHSEQALLPARLLILFALHEDMNSVKKEVESYYHVYPDRIKVLVALLVRHFHFWEDTTIDMIEASKLVEQDHLKLLQLEYSQDFPLQMDKAEQLKKELGITPLLPPFTKRSNWEMAINKLMSLTIGKESDTVSSAKVESQSRIVYCIDQGEQIIPRLQKSKDGVNWSKGRNIALTTFKQQAVPNMNETDRHLSAFVKHYTGGWSSSEYSELNGVSAFAALAGYPLVFQSENPDVPVVITKEEPQIVVAKAHGGYRVSVNVAPPYDAATLLRKENDQLFRVISLTPLQRKVMETFATVSYFPITAKEQMTELLSRLGQVITIHSDLIQNDEKLKTVKGDSLITVQLQPMGDGVKAELFVKPFIEQPPYCKAGEGASSVIGAVMGTRVQALRNLKKETQNFDIISRIMKKISGDPNATDVIFFDDYYQCLELIDALREQTKISRTEWPEGVKFSVKQTVDFSQLNLSVKGAGQWFEVDGALKIDARTQIKIGQLLEKVRQSKGRFIALGNSEFLALSQQLRKQLEEIDSMLTRDKKHLQLSRLNTAVITGMESMGVLLEKDNSFIALQERIEQAEKEHYKIPKGLQAELRSYQEDGFQWMSRLAHWGAGACLADDMGLGKTIQAIALLLSRSQQGASLVIAPASVLLNWKSEIERFAPTLTPLVMHDADGDRSQLVSNAANGDVVLTTYGLLVKEAELLTSKAWNIIILDEAHTIKNKETKMSKAAMELNGQFRLLLTGTPLQNHLGEIWNLFQFANPSLLGSFQQFNDHFIVPIEKAGDKLRQKQLKKMLQPFLLRRTKTQVLDELPEKTEITLPVELSEEERALYENLRQQALLNLEEHSSNAMQALAEITRLRQAACHPALVNKELTLTSAKTQAFLKLMDELISNNHRALVFSQFTSHLALIRKELEERGVDYLYLDGSISVNERAALVKQFQAGEQPLFLISLKAGGTGLNLTAADYVIHLDPWWNPAIEDQASDRAHRIGQTRPVTIYRLIAVQTIEEKIIKLHQTKKSLADSLLDGSDIAHKLTKEEMLELLRGTDYR